MDNQGQTLTLSNNRTEGHGRRETDVPISEVVSDFRGTEHANSPAPFNRRFNAFILDYEVDGLKRYAPIPGDLRTEIRLEYDRQRNAEG